MILLCPFLWATALQLGRKLSNTLTSYPLCLIKFLFVTGCRQFCVWGMKVNFEDERAGCPDPLVLVGKTMLCFFCVLLQHISLILLNSFIARLKGRVMDSTFSHWEMDSGIDVYCFCSMLHALYELIVREGYPSLIIFSCETVGSTGLQAFWCGLLI